MINASNHARFHRGTTKLESYPLAIGKRPRIHASQSLESRERKHCEGSRSRSDGGSRDVEISNLVSIVAFLSHQFASWCFQFRATELFILRERHNYPRECGRVGTEYFSCRCHPSSFSLRFARERANVASRNKNDRNGKGERKRDTHK